LPHASGTLPSNTHDPPPSWHFQHDLVSLVEQDILWRDADTLTAFTGYAGSVRTAASSGHVCYHGADSDYGALGHAEVVSLDFPPSLAEKVADVFFSNTCVKGRRRDSQDWGAEYRSLIGLPGGLESDMGQSFASVAAKRGVTLRAGRGGDEDAHGVVWVMDATVFRFHQAEIYHQFHDDMSEYYGRAYNGLRSTLAASGHLKPTGCPRD